jgi:hypothetical protein
MVSQGCTLICFFQDACRATANTWPPDSFKTVVFYWPPAREIRTYCCGSHVPSLLTPEHPISRTSVKESSINTVSHNNSEFFSLLSYYQQCNNPLHSSFFTPYRSLPLLVYCLFVIFLFPARPFMSFATHFPPHSFRCFAQDCPTERLNVTYEGAIWYNFRMPLHLPCLYLYDTFISLFRQFWTHDLFQP